MYIVVNNPNEAEESGFDVCGWILIVCSYILVIISFPITAFFCINVCKQKKRFIYIRKCTKNNF